MWDRTICNWEVWEESSQRVRMEKQMFSKAQWEKFMYLCSVASTEIDLNEDVEEIDRKFREVIKRVAGQTIAKSRCKMKKREYCSTLVD